MIIQAHDIDEAIAEMEAHCKLLAVEQAILDLLHSQGPCTLDEIVKEVLLQTTTPKRTVLSVVMGTIAGLMEVCLICDFEQDIDDPIGEHAWVTV